MATVSDVLTFSRAQAQTDSNGLTNANGLIWANEALLDFRRRLITAGVDASQLQEAYKDSDTSGTYLYPTDMFWLKSIELNYSGSAVADAYVTATQLDVANIPGGKSFGWLRTNASTSKPYFDDRGDWFEVFPTPTTSASQMIRIFYYLEPTEYSNVGNAIEYPESLDYRTLGWKIASSYLYSLGNLEQGAAFESKYEERVRQLISTLSRGSQMPIQATPLSISGWEF